MSPTDVNRQRVKRRLSRLRSTYGDVPVHEGEETLSADRFETLRESAEDGYTGGSYAWIVREPEDAPDLSETMPADAREQRPHVLLILGRGGEDENRWAIPGGGREDGETAEEATVREVREETGLEVDLEAPYLVYRCRTVPDDGRGVRLHTLWTCFDATYEGGSVRLQPEELRGAAWFPTPPLTLGPWAQYRAADWWDREPEEPWWEAGEPW